MSAFCTVFQTPQPVRGFSFSCALRETRDASYQKPSHSAWQASILKKPSRNQPNPFRPARARGEKQQFTLTRNPLLHQVRPGWRRVKRLIFSISKLDIRSVDEIYEFAICPWSGEAAAEPGTIWLVRDFLPLFPLSARDSWMPANRGRGAWQLQAESNALMPCRATNANFLQVGEGRIRRIDGECGKGARGRWCAKRMGRRERLLGSH